MTMRKPLIAGNWKMHKDAAEAAAFAKELSQAVAGYDEADVLIAPSFTALDRVVQAVAGSPVQVAAQNVHPQPQGAFTGETSVAMLQAVAVTHCLVGHSERRHVFGERDDFLREKVEALLAGGLQPIVCIGETLEEREAGQTEARVEAQLRAALEGLSAEQMASITVAYEPVWAIGTGHTATPQQAQQVHAFLRRLLSQIFDRDIAARTRILYGGSVKPANVKDLMAEEDIDGALVGGASLKLESFKQLVMFAQLD